MKIGGKMKIDVPKYQQIAVDIAGKIAEGFYQENEKIYVRSSIASQYGVSSETARRAICVLSDIDIVKSTKGSGIVIQSRERAIEFVNKYNSIRQIGVLKKDIIKNIEEQTTKNAELKAMISELLYKTERFKAVNPFIPFEIEMTSDAGHLGESISEMNFWHNTSATIIAIKREENMIISPGPYAVVKEGDTIYYLGDENSQERVKNFLYSSQP